MPLYRLRPIRGNWPGKLGRSTLVRTGLQSRYCGSFSRLLAQYIFTGEVMSTRTAPSPSPAPCVNPTPALSQVCPHNCDPNNSLCLRKLSPDLHGRCGDRSQYSEVAYTRLRHSTPCISDSSRQDESECGCREDGPGADSLHVRQYRRT
jgi:hypothetical protein